MSFVGGAQSAVFTVIIEHKPAAWAIGFNIDFWSTVYGVSIICLLIYIFKLRNAIFTIFSQQFQRGKLLLSIISGPKNNFNDGFKLESVTTYHLGFVIKILCTWQFLFKINILIMDVTWQGVVVSGLIIFIQLWCTEEKGPVFVTMFNPLTTILVASLAYFVLGEKLYMGR